MKNSTALGDVIKILTNSKSDADFAANIKTPHADLQIEVAKSKPLSFPLSVKAIKGLIELARPARFGWREKTLLDRKVRDVWEVPASKVKIAKRAWNQTLNPVLAKLSVELGLGEGVTLNAHLHNLLIYETGQFFSSHQDSEKYDGMVASLVVVLPSIHSGGALVVEHQGSSKQFRHSKTDANKLNFIAFYADCQHKIKPLTSGYRVALTYNLVLEEKNSVKKIAHLSHQKQESSQKKLDLAQPDALHTALQNCFAANKNKQKESLPKTLAKIAVLLDHQYTPAGLSWTHLKGSDRLRADALRAAAQALGYDVYLALADIRETWDCAGNDYDYNDYYSDDDAGPSEDYELNDLIDSEVDIKNWLDADGKKADFPVMSIDDEEMAWFKSNDECTPFESTYEGWMGNYGNTLDRWYHRAAVVVWPQEHRYLVLLKFAPDKCFKELYALAKDKSTRPQAVIFVQSILSSEGTTQLRRLLSSSATSESSKPAYVFKLALQLENSALAKELLMPLTLALLTPSNAKTLVALEKGYGSSWVISILATWAQQKTYGRFDTFENIGKLIEQVHAVSSGSSAIIAWCLANKWAHLQQEFTDSLQKDTIVELNASAKNRQQNLKELLSAAICAGDADLFRQIFSQLLKNKRLLGLPYICALLADCKQLLSGKDFAGWGGELFAQQLFDEVSAALGKPMRASENWAMDYQHPCACGDCKILSSFLRSPSEKKIVLPLSKERRRHMHSRIESSGLPVTHVTQRIGSPHKLVLTKTQELFTRESLAREKLERALKSL